MAGVEGTHRLRWTPLMRDKKQRSKKGRQEPSLTREAETVVVRLPEKVLEHGVSSTALGTVPAGGPWLLDNWICVRKKREGRKRERSPREGGEKERLNRLSFLLPLSCLAWEYPALEGGPSLVEASGRLPSPVPPSEVPSLKVRSRYG